MSGKLFVVGIGPNGKEQMTFSAYSAIDSADFVVGYTKYIERIQPILNENDEKIIMTGMKRERDRVRRSIELVESGHKVALISSGDSGVYGMATLALEMANTIDVEIVPGVTAASSAAAILGSPIALDFAVLSLSDLLVSFEKIKRRARCFAQSGVTTCLYNPVSTKRKKQFEEVLEIFREERKDFMIAVVKNAFMIEQEAYFFKLSEASLNWMGALNMMCIVFFCDEDCVEKDGKIFTPRGYKL